MAAAAGGAPSRLDLIRPCQLTTAATTRPGSHLLPMPLDQPSISGIKKETDLLSIPLAAEAAWNMEEIMTDQQQQALAPNSQDPKGLG